MIGVTVRCCCTKISHNCACDQCPSCSAIGTWSLLRVNQSDEKGIYQLSAFGHAMLSYESETRVSFIPIQNVTIWVNRMN